MKALAVRVGRKREEVGEGPEAWELVHCTEGREMVVA